MLHSTAKCIVCTEHLAGTGASCPIYCQHSMHNHLFSLLAKDLCCKRRNSSRPFPVHDQHFINNDAEARTDNSCSITRLVFSISVQLTCRARHPSCQSTLLEGDSQNLVCRTHALSLYYYDEHQVLLFYCTLLLYLKI